MNTAELSYNEMKTFVKENNIEVENMKKETLAAAIVSFEPEKTEKRGRPINPNSARQLRLAKVGTVKRGRPADPTSAWNIKQAELAAKREAGTLKQGRPVDPTSARQMKIAAKQAIIDAGGVVKRGRPAKVVEVEPTNKVDANTEPAKA